MAVPGPKVTCAQEMRLKLKGWTHAELGVLAEGLPSGYPCKGVATSIPPAWGAGGVPHTPPIQLSLLLPRSFQLTVEMFDYMDCELKLSESGERRGDPRCAVLSHGAPRDPQSAGRRGLFHPCSTPGPRQACPGRGLAEGALLCWPRGRTEEGRAGRTPGAKSQVSDHLLPRAVGLGQSHPFFAMKGL